MKLPAARNRGQSVALCLGGALFLPAAALSGQSNPMTPET